MRKTDWTARYAGKIAGPEEAIKRLAPGRRILIGSGAAEPVALVEAMVTHGTHLADNDVVHLLTLGPAPYVRPDLQHRFRHTAFFIGPNVREAIREGRADFMPVFLSEIPHLIRSRRVRIDAALIQVSEPDAHGYVSLGVSVDIVRAAVDAADLILAEVNPHMPRTLGDSFLHVDRIDALVPVGTELLERVPEPPDEVSAEIGRQVASLVPDGATLQVGIGKIPDSVLASLADRKDLGVHSEMISDGVMALADAGVITGRRKKLLPGKIVTSFIMGSRSLYRWAHEHPAIEMRPSDFTNDPQTVSRNNAMIAINSALSVDLTGQVASDTLLGRLFSGIGGQVDFIRGSARSEGGKAIIALRSTAKDHTVSRIRPVLEEGSAVVTSRGDVHYVVTEYGVADLWGKNIRERATALISIAHPDHRPELLSAGKNRRYLFPDQVVPHARYPWAEERLVRLSPGGPELLIRAARITDERSLQEFFYRLSEETLYKRFLSLKRMHPHREMQDLVNLDFDRNMGLIACLPGTEEVVGLARYDVDPASRLADIAFLVRDDWQGRGVATNLLRRMRDIARARGLAGFTADVLTSNSQMLAVFHESGLAFRSEIQGDVYHLEARFDEAGTSQAPAKSSSSSDAAD